MQETAIDFLASGAHVIVGDRYLGSSAGSMLQLSTELAVASVAWLAVLTFLIPPLAITMIQNAEAELYLGV